MDSSGHYFSSETALQECKKPTKDRYVCRQEHPLLSSLVQEECAIRLLKGWNRLPGSCEPCAVDAHGVDADIRVDLLHTGSGQPDGVRRSGPGEVPLKGAGKLTLDPTCKGYSRAALLQPVSDKRKQFQEWDQSVSPSATAK